MIEYQRDKQFPFVRLADLVCYSPLYANGKESIIEEQDVYRIEIPYVPTLQGSDIDTTQKSTLKSTLKGTRKEIHGKLPSVVLGNSRLRWDALWEDRLLVAVMTMRMNSPIGMAQRNVG